MDQDDWLPCAPVAVMQPDAIDLDEGPFRRMPALGSARGSVISEGECAKGNGTQREGPCASGFWEEVHGCLFYVMCGMAGEKSARGKRTRLKG